MTAPGAVGRALLARGETFGYDFTFHRPAEIWVVLTLAAPGTSWARGEAAVASLEVDGGEPQQIVLAGADEPVEYARLLGRIAAGPHRLSLGLDPALSAAAACVLECRGHRDARRRG